MKFRKSRFFICVWYLLLMCACENSKTDKLVHFIETVLESSKDFNRDTEYLVFVVDGNSCSSCQGKIINNFISNSHINEQILVYGIISSDKTSRDYLDRIDEMKGEINNQAVIEWEETKNTIILSTLAELTNSKFSPYKIHVRDGKFEEAIHL